MGVAAYKELIIEHGVLWNEQIQKQTWIIYGTKYERGYNNNIMDVSDTDENTIVTSDPQGIINNIIHAPVDTRLSIRWFGERTD